MNTKLAQSDTLLSRAWQYQKERFPVFKTALLIGFFTTATLIVSSRLGGRSLPSLWSFIAMWASVFLIFFQMRVFDEMKDFETDKRFRPERAVPRGLVTIKELKICAVIAAIIILALTSSISTKNLWPLCLLWIWLFLMTNEFFVPNWLKSHPFSYLFSHMAIMPLIDFYVSSADWMRGSSGPPHGLLFFLLLSFANGCVLEFGRKIWAPENEREGVETYSKLLGRNQSLNIWLCFILTAWVLLLAVSYLLNSMMVVFPISLLGLLYVFNIAQGFRNTPTDALEKKLDNASGLWVVLCYGLAGLPPLMVSLLA